MKRNKLELLFAGRLAQRCADALCRHIPRHRAKRAGQLSRPDPATSAVCAYAVNLLADATADKWLPPCIAETIDSTGSCTLKTIEEVETLITWLDEYSGMLETWPEPRSHEESVAMVSLSMNWGTNHPLNPWPAIRVEGCDGFVMHETLYTPEGWAVTHAASGRPLVQGLARDKAKAALRQWAALRTGPVQGGREADLDYLNILDRVSEQPGFFATLTRGRGIANGP